MPERLSQSQQGCMTVFETQSACSCSFWWRLAAGAGVAAVAAAAVGASGHALKPPSWPVPSLGLYAVLLLLAAAAAAAAAALNPVTSEALVVLEGVGVLLLTRRRRGGAAAAQFLDLADIHSVFVHETLTTTAIHTHLAFLLHDCSELAVAFPHLSPRLPELTRLYQQLRKLLPGLWPSTLDVKQS